MSHNVFRLRQVRVEQIQNAAALGVGHALDVRREARVDEQRFAPGLRMHSHDGVGHRNQLGDFLSVPDVSATATTLLQVVAELPVTVVHGRKIFDEALHRSRQRLVCELRVGPVRVASVARQHNRAQDRAHWRSGHERDVGVPDVGETVVGAVERVHLGGHVAAVPHGVSRGEIAYATAEFDVRCVVELLVAQHDHLVLDQRGPDGADLVVGGRGDVDAADFGAESWAEFVDVELDTRRDRCRRINRRRIKRGLRAGT